MKPILGSVRAGSIAASRVEHALSEVVSSINSSYQPYRQGPNHSWILQAQIWLHMGKCFTSHHLNSFCILNCMFCL